MKEKVKNLKDTVKIKKEAINLKDILEIKIIDVLMPIFFTREGVSRARYLAEALTLIIISPLLLVSIITFKICDIVVYLYKKFFKKGKDENERD